MKLVLLAAGHGRRFGGLKQTAAVGPAGEAIMDYTVRFAERCGYDGIVVVIREEIRTEIEDHLRRRWDLRIPVELVAQPERPGTAYAVACARQLVDSPFAVANADDLYEHHALATVRHHFDDAERHAGREAASVLVAYQLTKTVLTAAEVKRGVCRVSGSGRLERIVEHKVRLRTDGRFDAVPLAEEHEPGGHLRHSLLAGEELVSMNLWGFTPAIFDHLETATAPYEPGGPEHEILLPEVVGALVRERKVEVRVERTASRCYGVTHRDDVPLVREHLELQHEEGVGSPAIGHH